MSSVKQLMAKFQAKASSTSAVPTPISFEEQKRLARQRELEEIRLAREKAMKYNATLRAKTIQLAKEQSQKMRGAILVSPRNSSNNNAGGGSSGRFNFESTNNPSFAGQPIAEEEELPGHLDSRDFTVSTSAAGDTNTVRANTSDSNLPSSASHQPQDEQEASIPRDAAPSVVTVAIEEKSVYEVEGAEKAYLPLEEAHLYGLSASPPKRTESSQHVLERHGSSFEEKKDVLTELPSPSVSGARTSRLSQQKEAILQAQAQAQAAAVQAQGVSSGMSVGSGGISLPAAEEVPHSTIPRATSGKMKNLTSARSMADMTIPPSSMTSAPSFSAAARHSPSSRKDSDLCSVTSVMVLVPEQPEGGYDEIHEAVRFNRPSVSDLLLKPTLGERNFSVTSVGPMVEAPSEEPCRLLPGVDLRTVIHTFYSTYAPEKLDDLDLVLRHFKGRTEALLFTLECKYFVAISPEGYITPYRPSEAPHDAEKVEDELVAARRSTMMSTATDMTDFTTDSYKGYVPADARDGGLPATLANSWAVRPKHDSGRREGRKTALLLKKVGSDFL